LSLGEGVLEDVDDQLGEDKAKAHRNVCVGDAVVALTPSDS
jgi:hypothetical protein